MLHEESTIVEIVAIGDFQLLKLPFTNVVALKGDY